MNLKLEIAIAAAEYYFSKPEITAKEAIDKALAKYKEVQDES